eukprot:15723681-Heterocapsa_arctica.AAC.1
MWPIGSCGLGGRCSRQARKGKGPNPTARPGSSGVPSPHDLVLNPDVGHAGLAQAEFMAEE